MTEAGRSHPLEINSEDSAVTLRQFTPQDAADIFNLIDQSRDHLSQHGDTTAEKYPDLESVKESIEHPKNPNRLRFGIRNLEGQLVGSINLTPDAEDPQRGEVGYYLGQAYTGKGYMGSALTALTGFAFSDLQYETLYGKVQEDNAASARVLERAGFREAQRVNGEIVLVRNKD